MLKRSATRKRLRPASASAPPKTSRWRRKTTSQKTSRQRRLGYAAGPAPGRTPAGAGGWGLGFPLWSDEDGEEDDIAAIDDPRRDCDGTSVGGVGVEEGD